MAEEVKDLPQGWTVDEEPKQEEAALPGGWKIDEPEKKVSLLQDIVSQDLRAQGYEPDFSEELERLGGLGTAEALRGVFSGASFGLTEKIPGLQTENNIASGTGKALGALLPITRLFKVFGGGLTKLAAKSPILQKQATSLANLLGITTAGVAHFEGEELVKGRQPSGEELLDKGLEWAAIDIGLGLLGKGYQFAKGLFSKGGKEGAYEVLDNVVTKLKDSGVDLNQPEKVAEAALQILEKEPEIATRELRAVEKPESPVSKKAQEVISNPNQLQFETKLDKKTQQPESKPIEPIQEVARERFNQEAITPQDLRGKKISQEKLTPLIQESRFNAEPYQPDNVSFVKEAEALENSTIEKQIETVGERATSEQELGTAIKEDVEKNLQEARDNYKPLYEEAEAAAEGIMHNPANTAREAGNRLQKLETPTSGKPLKTKPAEYEITMNKLEGILQDAGYKIQRALAPKGQKGAIELIVQEGEVPVANSIELGRRVNSLINFETIDPSVKNILKPVAAAIKQDVRAGLKSNPDALTAYELAEAEHARVANLYGKDSIRGIRRKEAGEKAVQAIKSPTAVEDMRNVLSPEQMLQVEREILEKMNEMSYEKAAKTYREMQKQLSADTRKIAKDIVESKNPHNLQFRKKQTQEAILNDMSNAFTTGARPEKTLNLWKTQKGQKIIKDTFKDSPNWSSVKEYLEKQTLNDMISSITSPSGVVDLKKLKPFLKDPAAMNNLRELGGEEAVQFFKGLEAEVKALENNVKLLDRLPTPSEAKRGKDLINRQKQRTLESKKQEAVLKEKQNAAQKKLNELISSKPGGEYGKESLRRTKEKNLQKPKETKVGEESIETGVRRKKETTGEHGQRLLERMAAKDFPIQAKTKKWKAWFADVLGLTPKAAMGVFALMKLGIPNTVITLVGVKLLTKMATSPAVRRAWKEAIKHKNDPIKFIAAWEHLGDVLDDEED